MNVVEMRNITKQYPGVCALDDVDFSLKKAEIHSLLGENGAGKSTLSKILYGLEKADQGTIMVNGKNVVFRSAHDAINCCIGMVHQHFMLAPVLTVTENITIGAEPRKGPWFDKKQAEKEVSDLINKFQFNIDPKEKVANLSVGEQQRVEILKAMYRKAEIFILDEPTAVLTPQETDELFRILRQLKSEGKSIILITHKLKETIAIADRLTVLRRGKVVEAGTSLENIKTTDLATKMVGREVTLGVSRRTKHVSDVCFDVSNLNYIKNNKQVLTNISLSIRKGEILGIAGVEGNGQSELISCLTGSIQPNSMDLKLNDKPLTGSCKSFIESGVGHVPEDRGKLGLIHSMTVAENMMLGYHETPAFNKHGLLRLKNIDDFCSECVNDFDIRTASNDIAASSLSGGNQQKIIIARVFTQNPDALIIAQPTRGVDVGAMQYIHEKMLDLRDSGKAILLISSDLDELISLSDRIAVIYEGQIVAQGNYDDFTQSQLGIMMNSGIKEQKHES